MAQHGTAWSEHEISVIVDSYFRMFRAELAGEHFVKSDENQRVGFLIERSKGAIDYKYANISAALDEAGKAYLTGYKPLRNIQSALRLAVIEYVEGHPEIDEQISE